MFKYLKFFFSVIILFYILSVVVPLYTIVACRRRDAQYLWSKCCAWYLGVRIVFTKDSQQVQTSKRTILLFNHRTQGDFFLHDLMTDASCNYLARWMVAVVFPLICLLQQICTQAVWFFRRGGNDLEKFYQWIDYRFEHSYRPNLLVYPEGHRMSDSGKPGKLKRGMISYAYKRKLDVQIGIAFGIEQAFNEKKLHVSLGPTTLTCEIDKPIRSTDYKTEEEFYQVVEKRFHEQFTKTFNAHYKKE